MATNRPLLLVNNSEQKRSRPEHVNEVFLFFFFLARIKKSDRFSVPRCRKMRILDLKTRRYTS